MDNFIRFTVFVLIVEYAQNILDLIVQSRNIYSLKRAFAHRYWSISVQGRAGQVDIVLKTSCTGPPYQVGEIWGGLALLPPRKEKNGYNSTILGVAETCRKHPKEGVTKDKTLIYFVNVQNGKS